MARRDVSGGAVHYYFADHLGSADVITSNTGAIQKESDYYPFGGEIVVSGSDANNYKFTGKERDGESNLDNFGARYDASSLGRFMTPDWAEKPIDVPYANFGNPQSLNLYSYAKNNPTTFGDPDGHDPGSAVAEPETVVDVVEKVAVESAPEEIEAGEGGSVLGPVGAAVAVTAVVVVGVGAYEYDEHFSDPGPPPAPKTPGAPSVTKPATAVPSPQMEAEHRKGARPGRSPRKDKHEKVDPGKSQPPNYKPDRKYVQPKHDKKKDRDPPPYHRKDRDKDKNPQQLIINGGDACPDCALGPHNPTVAAPKD